MNKPDVTDKNKMGRSLSYSHYIIQLMPERQKDKVVYIE